GSGAFPLSERIASVPDGGPDLGAVVAFGFRQRVPTAARPAIQHVTRDARSWPGCGRFVELAAVERQRRPHHDVRNVRSILALEPGKRLERVLGSTAVDVDEVGPP